jgi:predicted nucleic acid-binding protein
MKLDDILNGATALVDANILLYARRGKSLQCRNLLARCDSGSISGVVTTVILAEFAHRQMMVECQMLGLVASNPAKAMSRQPELVRGLSTYANDVRNLLGGGFQIETVQPEDFFIALELQKQHGLLTNDALNLAVARRLGITEIATADTHFDHIQGLIVYKPEDLIR